MMKHIRYFYILAGFLFLLGGCTNPTHEAPPANVQPRTFLWLFPDSTLAESQSKEHIRWWGEDPDGLVKGYLFTSGKLFSPGLAGVYSDTILWRWRTSNDTTILFPLRTKRDTFQVAVRAVDNSFIPPANFPDQAAVKFVRGGDPYWDVNENGIFDSGDISLPSLSNAVDPKGAWLGMPLLNQPPSVSFAADPNDPTLTMQQPETTFTAATFAWVGTDPDGDATIASYDIALNDTTNISQFVTVGPNIKLVTLLVPRSRSNGITWTAEVAADVWSGTYATSRRNIGQLPNLRMNNYNTFFVRARDVAGDVSGFIKLPADSTRKWYVKNPVGNVLIVDDYISSDKDSALSFYKRILGSSGFGNYEVLNIGAGLTAQQKLDSKFGKLVPSYLDPAFIYTLHLFDVVCWYSDEYPSLAVAQYPLYEYINDASHHGKVIFSTMFYTSSDPRGALKDFAPLDSISTVDLSPSRLLPAMGDTRIPRLYSLYPDPSRVADGFPDSLQFNPTPANHLLYFRPIYKRPDAEYIYRLQADPRTKGKRYGNLATSNDLNGLVHLPSGKILTCGGNGTILVATDGGTDWKSQTSGVTQQLNSVFFADESNGWIAGDGGTILKTTDGGSTWNLHSYFTFENLKNVHFVSLTKGYICGSTGILLRTQDGGVNWDFLNSGTSVNLYSVQFYDQSNGVATGDAGTIIRTTDGGSSWVNTVKAISRALYSVKYKDASNLFAVGAKGGIVASTNGGVSWGTRPTFTTNDLKCIYFLDVQNGWTCGSNGSMFKTSDGSLTWNIDSTGIEQSGGIGQTVNSVLFTNMVDGYLAGTGGIIMKSSTGGNPWSIVPGGSIQAAIIDGVGSDGKRSFVFFGLPLHLLDGNPSSLSPSPMQQFFKVVLHNEFGL